jgi:hypothetical protein
MLTTRPAIMADLSHPPVEVSHPLIDAGTANRGCQNRVGELRPGLAREPASEVAWMLIGTEP